MLSYLPPEGFIDVRDVRRLFERLERALSDWRGMPARWLVESETRGCPGPVGIILRLESSFGSSLPPSDLRPVAEVGI